MNNYTDKYGRLHDKPTDGVNPSSNNGWIYTAYASKVGLQVNHNMLLNCWSECWTNQEYFALRSPNKPSPPFSRDEVLGVVSLGVMQGLWLEAHGWNFSPYPIPKLSIPRLFTQAKALLIIQPYYKRILGVDVKLVHFELAHRNFFWQNNLDQIYRFAFSVPIQDRYSILKWSGRFKFYRPDHLFYGVVSLIDRRGKPTGMRWLKYGGEKNLKAMVQEFPADHPIRVKAGL